MLWVRCEFTRWLSTIEATLLNYKFDYLTLLSCTFATSVITTYDAASKGHSLV